MRNNFLCKTKHREHFTLDSTELQTHCLDLVKTYRLYLNTSFTRVTVIMQFGNKIQAIAFCSPTVLNRIMAEYFSFWHDSTPIVQEKHSNKNLRQIALDKYFETYHQH